MSDDASTLGPSTTDSGESNGINNSNRGDELKIVVSAVLFNASLGRPMPVTFEQARAIVTAAYGSPWEGPGTFHVADWGWESATEFLMVVGPRESIVDDDDDYLMLPGLTVFVSKETGEVIERNPLPNRETAAVLDAMTPYGDVPDEDDV